VKKAQREVAKTPAARPQARTVVLSARRDGGARVVPYVLEIDSGDTIRWVVDGGRLARAEALYLVEFSPTGAVRVKGRGAPRLRDGQPVRVSGSRSAVVTGPRERRFSYKVVVFIGGEPYSDLECPSIIIR